ncbi:FxSxx-COOH system tetratricopeptide repeat protein [Thermopolyspora sp. NPDC052614]|uniref:FxSxx-COOH system tetratricopeptide repeat protein n=1 Tax=Thermopolyspora sp. NPDC052614 TaxID=3155682 RepID=UPI003430134C
MARRSDGGRRKPTRPETAWASIAAIIAGFGAYASVLAQVDGPLNGARLAWTVIAVIGTAAFTFLSMTLGSAIVGAQTGPRRTEIGRPAPAIMDTTITNLPPRNPNFVGRAEMLEDLRRRMNSGERRSQAVCGLGGVGKTQVALEYAHRFQDSYDIVWWIHAEQPASIIEALLGLARALGLSEIANQADLLAALQSTLRGRRRWLLIFDNAEDVGVLAAYWPPGNGHVLVTSRGGDWNDLVADSVRIGVLSRAEAVEFLCRRAPSPDRDAAADLARELGNLPLALAQAAAYVNRTGTSLADYHELLLDRWSEISGIGRPWDYGETIATTWEMSVGKAEERAPGSRDLLSLIACLAPDDIPRGMIHRRAATLPAPLRGLVADRVAYDRMIMELAGYSLLSAGADRLDVHRLVQLTLRENLTEAEAARWAEHALALLEAEFPTVVTRPRTWPLCARLLPHVLVVCGHAERYGVARAACGRLLHLAAHYLHWRADYDQARELFERALALRENAFGPEHPEVAETLSELARLCFHRAELDAARRHVERALAIRQAALDDRRPHHCADGDLVAEDLVHLGRVLREQSDLPGAREVTERALRLREDAHGHDDPKAAEYADLLGIILWRLGDLEGSLRAHERSLRTLTAAYGPDHPEVATCRKHLGVVCRDLGRLLDAERHLESAAAIMTREFGDEHLETMTVLVRLWDVRRRLGDAAGARENLERLADRRADRLGEHPDVALCLVCLGAALRDQGELEPARAVLDHALAIYTRIYGHEHPYRAEALMVLGPVRYLLGEAVEARRTLEDALMIFEKAYGPEHPCVADALECLAPMVAAAGDQARSEAYVRRHLEIRARAAGCDP